MNFLYENNDEKFDISKLNDGTLLVQVKVKDFSGQFCYCIEDENLADYVQYLKQLDESEQGEFKFAELDSDSFIHFEKTKVGHIKISGQLGMTFRNNYLIFEMDADQTVITNLIERLK